MVRVEKLNIFKQFFHQWKRNRYKSLKTAKYEVQKSSTCSATLFRCKFSSTFPVFNLAWSTLPATKTFVVGWRNAARWFVDLPGHEQICCPTSCVFDEKRATKPKFVAQSRPMLYFSQQLFSTRNKCFCCATSWSRKVKNGKHRRKLATKQCCASSWGFLYLVSHRLYLKLTRARDFSGIQIQDGPGSGSEYMDISRPADYFIACYTADETQQGRNSCPRLQLLAFSLDSITSLPR